MTSQSLTVLLFAFVSHTCEGALRTTHPSAADNQARRVIADAQALESTAKEVKAPKTADWEGDYDGDKFANCLMEHKCSANYHPACAGGKTYDSNCHARCAGFEKDQVQFGECGGCLAPQLCCQKQEGGISKAINWESGEAAANNLVCVASEEGRRCPDNHSCMESKASESVPEKEGENAMRSPPAPTTKLQATGGVTDAQTTAVEKVMREVQRVNGELDTETQKASASVSAQKTSRPEITINKVEQAENKHVEALTRKVVEDAKAVEQVHATKK